ncbi:MAG: ABC transporter permease [archaeon]|nr:ABC transporter permease [archaeon]
MKVLDLAFNNFKFLSRDKKNLLFLILFPIIFMVIFGSVFGGDYFDDGTFAVGILNLDEGYNDYNLSSDFIQVLEDAEYDNSNHMFKITNVSDQTTGES